VRPTACYTGTTRALTRCDAGHISAYQHFEGVPLRASRTVALQILTSEFHSNVALPI
jgi:hypothetical protein